MQFKILHAIYRGVRLIKGAKLPSFLIKKNKERQQFGAQISTRSAPSSDEVEFIILALKMQLRLVEAFKMQRAIYIGVWLI